MKLLKKLEIKKFTEVALDGVAVLGLMSTRHKTDNASFGCSSSSGIAVNIS